MSGRKLFPAFLDLDGVEVLLLGEGEAADRRAATLREAGARIRHARLFAPHLLDGVALAIGADAPSSELAALHANATARGIPVNCVDRPSLSSFVTPAVVDRLPMQIAICSNGAAPVLSRLLRARIETLVDPAYGKLAALAARFKEETRARLPDVLRRRRMLERTLGGDAAAAMLAGDAPAAERAYRDALDAAEADAARPEIGIVHLLETGDGIADLLTLRALRLLGEADVIVHGPDESASVLEIARRDAARRVVEGAVADTLIGLARAGSQVVRLSPQHGEAEALARAGVLHLLVPAPRRSPGDAATAH